MKRIGRRPFLFGSALLAACGGQVLDDSKFENGDFVPSPQRPPPPPIDDLFPEAGPRPSVTETCRDTAPNTPQPTLTGLGERGPFPNVVYSWTTDEQAAGLRAGDPIFTRATTTTGQRGYVFDLLAKRAEAGDAIAKVLAGPAFELGRFAWPFAAGTRISPEKYGDQLVAIELEKEARVVAFSALGNRYTVFDLAGNVVPDGMSAPERIGAFFFTNDSTVTSSSFGLSCIQDTFRGALVYRELYLGNPAMVARYSLSTPAIHARLDAEAKDVRSLADTLDCRGVVLGGCESIVRSWYPSGGNTRIDRFFRSLAFAVPLGSAGNGARELRALADDLGRIDRTGAPLVVDM